MVASCWKKGRAHHWQHQPKGSLASRMVGGCGSLDWANWAAVVFKAIWLWTQITPVMLQSNPDLKNLWDPRRAGENSDGFQGKWVVSGIDWLAALISTAGVFPFLYFPHSVLLSEWLSMSLLLWELDSELPHPRMGLMGFWTAACPWLSVLPLYLSPHDSGSFIFIERTHCWLSAWDLGRGPACSQPGSLESYGFHLNDSILERSLPLPEISAGGPHSPELTLGFMLFLTLGPSFAFTILLLSYFFVPAHLPNSSSVCLLRLCLRCHWIKEDRSDFLPSTTPGVV